MKIKNKKILIIDDNELSLRAIEKSFKMNGVEVDVQLESKIGLQKHILNRYNIIFSDIMMPDIDGFELTRYIKQITPDTLVYLFTGFYSEEVLKKGIEAGAEKVFEKPIPICEILDNYILKQKVSREEKC